jgi:transposase
MLPHRETMRDEHIPLGIPNEDWTATPFVVRASVLALLQQHEQLQQHLAALEERLKQNSHNSSKPPSSDPPTMPRYPKRRPSGRKVGGQPGHIGRTRLLKPLDQVQRVIELRPIRCYVCGALMLGEDPQPQRPQVTELPHIEPQVTE